MDTRMQLTLFVKDVQAKAIEATRRQYNPEQYALIKAHVTLCREDELQEIDQVIKNLENLKQGPITIFFDPVVRFAAGKGVLLPGCNDNLVFHS